LSSTPRSVRWSPTPSTGGVIDIYAAAGIDKPDISITGDDFARRLSTNPHRNLQIELLRRLLTSELKTVAKRNLLVERKFSDMLEGAMRSYANRSLDAAELIAELLDLAKAMRAEHDRGSQLGLGRDELGFYDAVCQNDSAVLERGTG
jgi:type I restriction enzyme R subunit